MSNPLLIVLRHKQLSFNTWRFASLSFGWHNPVLGVRQLHCYLYTNSKCILCMHNRFFTYLFLYNFYVIFLFFWHFLSFPILFYIAFQPCIRSFMCSTILTISKYHQLFQIRFNFTFSMIYSSLFNNLQFSSFPKCIVLMSKNWLSSFYKSPLFFFKMFCQKFDSHHSRNLLFSFSKCSAKNLILIILEFFSSLFRNVLPKIWFSSF